MPPLCILLLGDTERTEFRDARLCLDRWGTIRRCGEIDAAAAMLTEGEVVPDVIVVAQAFPGQFSHEAIDRLRRLAPLARIVGLMGSWCEGEMRTGLPWPGVVRTYWHQWASRCDRELRRLAQGECCSWMLPPTATEEERLLAGASSHDTVAQRGAFATACLQAVRGVTRSQRTACKQAAAHGGENSGLVLISAQSREMAEWLSAACRSRGYSTVWQRTAATAHVDGATAAIFDGTDLGAEECGDLGRLAAALRPAPVLALLAFPRVEDHQRAISAGAAAVVSKPLAVGDLFWELERVASAVETDLR